MKFAFGIGALILGYTVLYYGMCLYRNYNSSTGTSAGIPFGILLGIPQTSGNAANAMPPFQFGGTV
jgi:hypothetical protein